MLRSEIIEQELGPNDAQRWCAENAEWIFRIVNVNKYNALNVNEDIFWMWVYIIVDKKYTVKCE